MNRMPTPILVQICDSFDFIVEDVVSEALRINFVVDFAPYDEQELAGGEELVTNARRSLAVGDVDLIPVFLLGVEFVDLAKLIDY